MIHSTFSTTTGQQSELLIDDLAKHYFALADFEGFIQHPKNNPIQVRQLNTTETQEAKQRLQNLEPCTGIGVSFDTQKYYSPGCFVEIKLDSNGTEHCFFAKVVMVRNHDTYFTIGVWFDHKQEAGRIRKIEQICHLENYLREKRCKDGPYISSDIIAKQWLETFSNVFPIT